MTDEPRQELISVLSGNRIRAMHISNELGMLAHALSVVGNDRLSANLEGIASEVVELVESAWAAHGASHDGR